MVISDVKKPISVIVKIHCPYITAWKNHPSPVLRKFILLRFLADEVKPVIF